MLRLYDSRLSGNGWKVRLLANELGIALDRRILDLRAGEGRTPEFLRKNPLGRVPVLELDDGETIWESNAILLHLAEGSRLLPRAGVGRSHVLSWLFFEQADHMRNFARARYLVSIVKTATPASEEIKSLHELGHRALAVMEHELGHGPFITGGDYTVADIALFPYTSLAPDGGYDLAIYPAVLAWLARVRAQPNYIPLLTT